MRLVIALFFALSLNATTVTVCASGCDYNNFQTAMDATASNCAIDVVQLAAGEEFAGAFRVPYRPCVGQVWVRSSGHASLTGRVAPSDVGNMATLRANTGNEGALEFTVRKENPMTAVDTGTDIVTISATTWTNGMAFSCSNTPPSPMVGGTIYYVRDVASNTFKVAATPGGAALDLTDAGSTGASYYSKPHCIEVAPRRDWRFTGVRFTLNSGLTMSQALIIVGNLESNELALPANIWFDRVLVQGHGNMGADYPNGGIQARGINIRITDSYFSDIRCFSCEGKPIFSYASPGPLDIRNNTIIGGSIGILIGGGGSAIPGQVQSNVTIEGNLIAGPGKEMYRQGSGAPTGSCYYGQGSGMFYLRTDIGGADCTTPDRCYTCQSNGTWASDAGAVIRTDDFLVKNRIELKECDNCVIRGNILQGQQSSVDTQGQCLNLTVINVPVDRYIRDTTLEDNYCTETWGGLSISAYGGLTRTSRNLKVENNLFTGLADERLLPIGGVNNDRVWQMRFNEEIRNTSLLHNSFVTVDSPITTNAGFGIYAEDNGDDASQTHYLADNVWWAAVTGSRTDSGETTCNTTASGWGVFFPDTGSKYVRNNVQYGGTGLGGLDACGATQNLATQATKGGVDFAAGGKLNATSPYSASCVSGCAFAATDGKDVGVDYERLQGVIGGAQTGSGALQPTVLAGSTRAILRYAPPSSDACTVTLYTDAGRQTLHGDTDIAGEQLDSRSGNVSVSAYRQFVFGTNTALTASTLYYAQITCGAKLAVVPIKTLAAGSGYQAEVGLSPAAAGEHSANADMSSPTSLGSSTLHIVPVSSNSVRYYRKVGGDTIALVAP